MLFLAKRYGRYKRYKPVYVWTLSVLPGPAVNTLYWVHVALGAIGMVNVIEGFMYLSIYRAIKR